MSSAIKPPGSGGPPGAGPAPEVGGASSTERGAFRAELDSHRAELDSHRAELDSHRAELDAPAADAARDVRSGGAGASARADALRALADEVRSGRIDARAAIDRLVERALGAGPAAALPPARRAELEALLRSALEEDPTLVAMQRDLARGR